MQFEIVNL